jgi:hypothetical protein
MSTYTCAMCHGAFEGDRSQEEKVAEYERLFGRPFDPDEVASVCHECWVAMGCSHLDEVPS